MIRLRPYQEKLETDVRAAFRDVRRVLMVAPTGAGKTITFVSIVIQVNNRGKRVWIIAHRIEIVLQISAALRSFGVSHGVIAPGHDGQDHPVMVGMVQSVARRLDKLRPPHMLVVDEAHHATAGVYRQITDAWPSVYVLGATATPARTDGTGLGKVFDRLVLGPSMTELITRGYLASYRYFAPPQVADLTHLKSRGGDYAADQIAAAMDNRTVTGDAVDHYRKYLNGAPAIAFCATVAHAHNTADIFRGLGWKAASVDGSMKLDQRASLIRQIGDGRLNVLTSCDVISEGTDIPSVAGAILLRPTQSLIIDLQQVGRVLRPKPDGSLATILDHVNNFTRHGMPDEAREWTLEGRLKRQSAPPVRQCQKCFAAFKPAPRCPSCGFVFPAELSPRQALKQRAGELEELRRNDEAAYFKEAPYKQVVKEAKTLEALMAIAKARGYDRRWAMRMFQMKSGGYRRAS